MTYTIHMRGDQSHVCLNSSCPMVWRAMVCISTAAICFVVSRRVSVKMWVAIRVGNRDRWVSRILHCCFPYNPCSCSSTHSMLYDYRYSVYIQTCIDPHSLAVPTTLSLLPFICSMLFVMHLFNSSSVRLEHTLWQWASLYLFLAFIDHWLIHGIFS